MRLQLSRTVWQWRLVASDCRRDTGRPLTGRLHVKIRIVQEVKHLSPEIPNVACQVHTYTCAHQANRPLRAVEVCKSREKTRRRRRGLMWWMVGRVSHCSALCQTDYRRPAACVIRSSNKLRKPFNQLHQPRPTHCIA